MEPYDDCIVYLLAKSYQKAFGILKKLLSPYGLTPVQNLVIVGLAEQDGLSAGELGSKLYLDGATLSGTLDRMSDNGWIEKKPDPKDGRRVLVYLTEKAKGNLKNLYQAREQANQAVLKPFSNEEKILLKRLLKDIQV